MIRAAQKALHVLAVKLGVKRSNMYRFDFSYDEYQRLLERCPFNDEEIKIIEMKRRGESNVKIQMELGLSDSALYTRIRRIANKISKEI